MEEKLMDFKYENGWHDMSEFARCEFVWERLVGIIPKFRDNSSDLIEELTLIKQLESEVRANYDSYVSCKKECIQGVVNKMLETLGE
ncbi:hypothetical protein UT300012_23520 [Paraclostridium bifermentans]